MDSLVKKFISHFRTAKCSCLPEIALSFLFCFHAKLTLFTHFLLIISDSYFIYHVDLVYNLLLPESQKGLCCSSTNASCLKSRWIIDSYMSIYGTVQNLTVSCNILYKWLMIVSCICSELHTTIHSMRCYKPRLLQKCYLG